MNKKNYIYDLETYKNFFCAVFNNDKEYIVFEISARKNEYEELIDFYKNNIKYAIGFNNVRFDAQIMQFLIDNFSNFKLLQGSELTKHIYEFVQNLIEIQKEGGFPTYPEYKLSIKQIDLYLINHYDNKNKSTS